MLYILHSFIVDCMEFIELIRVRSKRKGTIWFIELFIVCDTTIYTHFVCVCVCILQWIRSNKVFAESESGRETRRLRKHKRFDNIVIGIFHSFLFSVMVAVVVVVVMLLCIFFCCWCCCYFCFCVHLFGILLKYHWISLNRHHSLIFQEMIINLFESWPAALFDIIRTYRLYWLHTMYIFIYISYACLCLCLCVSFLLCRIVSSMCVCAYKLFSISQSQLEKFSKYCLVHYFTANTSHIVYYVHVLYGICGRIKFYRTHLFKVQSFDCLSISLPACLPVCPLVCALALTRSFVHPFQVHY